MATHTAPPERGSCESSYRGRCFAPVSFLYAIDCRPGEFAFGHAHGAHEGNEHVRRQNLRVGDELIGAKYERHIRSCSVGSADASVHRSAPGASTMRRQRKVLRRTV